MDYLQYESLEAGATAVIQDGVLNLVINGLPSILHQNINLLRIGLYQRFKPCYKWITFNTTISSLIIYKLSIKVLNLVINGLPSILGNIKFSSSKLDMIVLNLVINGLPSILAGDISIQILVLVRFKPCYKWITFNTSGGFS